LAPASWRIKRFATILIITVLLLPTVTLPSEAFITNSGFTVKTAPTNVATMLNETIIGPKDILVYKLIPGKNQVAVAGTGYVALVDLSKNPPIVLWAWSIIGRATSLITDNSKLPEWVVVGTDSGEVLAVNVKNPDFRVSYFTASRAPVERIGVGSVDGKTSLFVMDTEGYLYIYKLPQPGWMEIGPLSLDAPYGSIPGYTIGNASFREVYHNDATWSLDAERIAASIKTIDPGKLANVVSYVYLRFDNGSSIPAIPYGPKPTGNNSNVTIQATLYYATIYYPYNSIAKLEKAANATINITSVLPAKQAVAVFYLVEWRNKITQELVNSTCYAGMTGYFEPRPGQTYIAGKIYAVKKGGSLDDCIHSLGLKVMGNQTYSPVLAVRASTLPKKSPQFGSTGDAWIIPYPYPQNLRPPSEAMQWKYFAFDHQPAGWPAKANGMIVAGVDRYLYIYIVDSNLYPQEIGTSNRFLEIVDLGSPMTSIAVAPDGSSIFVGNTKGRLLWLKWDKDSMKYVSWAALQVGVTPVTSVSYLREGYVLATTAQGIIQLAKVTSNELVPMWRGPYGYSGIETGISQLTAQGISTNLIVAGSSVGHHATFYLLTGTPDIVRVAVNVKITRVSAEGGQVTLPTGTRLEVYSPAKKLVASLESDNGTFKIFLPSGNYIFRVYVPGLGYVTKTAKIAFPEYKATINLRIRTVTVSVYIPQPEKNETYPKNVKPGPVEGALVKAIPLKINPQVGYNMTVLNVSAVTGKDGVAILNLWDGVSYKLIVKAPGLKNYTTIIPDFGLVSLKVPLKPVVQKKKQKQVVQYYQVTIIVVNDKAKPLSRAVVDVRDSKGNIVFSGLTGPDGKVIARLLQGSYTVEARADGYKPSSMPLSVPGTSQVSLTLQPTTATKVKRMLPYILLLVGLIVIVAAFYAVRSKIASWISKEEEYF